MEHVVMLQLAAAYTLYQNFFGIGYFLCFSCLPVHAACA